MDLSAICKALFTLTLVGCNSVHTEIIINAKPEQVWAVLNATANYPEWNPTMIKADGSFEEGNEIKYRFRETAEKEYDINSTVKTVKKNKLINQKGGVWGVITFDHIYKLELVNEGTRVTQHEEYRGVYVPFWSTETVKAAYERSNLALKKRVESLSPGN